VKDKFETGRIVNHLLSLHRKMSVSVPLPAHMFSSPSHFPSSHSPERKKSSRKCVYAHDEEGRSK